MAKTRAYGSDAQLLAAFESTYGTAPDGSGGGVYTKLSFKESSLGAERPLGYDPLLGQGRDAQDPFYEAISDEGEFGVPLDLRGLGFWLKGLFGAPTTTDNPDGTYTHVFTSGGDLPSLTFEVGHTALSTPKFYRHTGAKLENLAFDMARTGPANAVAKGETSPASAADASPATLALKRFSQGSGTIKVGGSQLANVTGGRFSFSNNLERVETIRDDGLIDGADETEATAEGSIDVRFSPSRRRSMPRRRLPWNIAIPFRGPRGICSSSRCRACSCRRKNRNSGGRAACRRLTNGGRPMTARRATCCKSR